MGDTPQWRLTGFYGYPSRQDRQRSWNILRNLKHKYDLPWVVIGDFNDLMFQAEKRGPHKHPPSLLQGFVEALDNCELYDMGMLGYPFTWERGRGTEDWVEERLDLAVANKAWRDFFNQARVENLETVSSNHSALFLDIQNQTSKSRKRIFRFENAWLKDRDCSGIVKEAWRDSVGLLFQD